jgi:hypothetical protein
VSRKGFRTTEHRECHCELSWGFKHNGTCHRVSNTRDNAAEMAARVGSGCEIEEPIRPGVRRVRVWEYSTRSHADPVAVHMGQPRNDSITINIADHSQIYDVTVLPA